MKHKTLLIKNISKVVTVDDQDRVLTDVNIYIEDGVIKSIGKDTLKADETLDAKGLYAYPGLVNTHHHLYQTFTRNLPQVQHLELFDWLKYLYEIWRRLDQELIYHSSIVGMGELLKYGCTTNFDHHYVFPENSDDFIDTQFQAADDLGTRFHASRGSMSRGVSDGGLPPDDLVQSTEKILQESERLVKKYHDTRPYAMHQVAMGPCSPFSVTSELMEESAKLGRKLGIRLHTHLAETLDEERFCLDTVHMRPLEYMESLGWIGEDVWFAHGIHFNDKEIERLGKTGTGIAHCPVSNMKLTSGVAKIPDMLKHQVTVGLAVDGSASNDCSNLMAEMRCAYLLHRLNEGDKAPSAYDILKMATRGSAKLLGRSDIGRIEEKSAADLFFIDAQKLELVGTLQDPKSIFGAVGYNHPAKYVIVNGQIVVKDGNLVRMDEQKTAEKARQQVDRMLKDIV